jgi:hypothetical protein
MLWSKPERGSRAARKARDLAQRTFEIMKKEQTLGAGSTFQTMTAQRDLSHRRTGSGHRQDHLQKGRKLSWIVQPAPLWNIMEYRCRTQ